MVQAVSSIVNFTVLAFCLLLFVYGCYAVWDSQQITQAADTKRYEIYKPTGGDTRSFEELRAINPEVFGWLNVYGTNIDYPLVQGEDNDKYVNTNVDGEYSLIGSLFLDCRNEADFSDFNSIIYGHHMAQNRMFGEIADFKEPEYFDSHPYGSLFYGGRTYGLEFFAFLEVDAYDDVYSPGMEGEEARGAYLDRIWGLALNKRELKLDAEERLVLLSTCTSGMTNGRHILAGRITENVPEDAFYQEPKEKKLEGVDSQGLFQQLEKIPVWGKALAVGILLLILAGWVYGILERWKSRKR